jgi:hypothetical protein
MAGHYVCNSISHADLQVIYLKPKVKAGLLYHGAGQPNKSGANYSGWTGASRRVLSERLTGRDIGDRAYLPPPSFLFWWPDGR